MNVAQRVCIVTGGASGIGRALCRRLAAEDARVVVSDVDLAGAEAVAAEIGGVAFRADVAEERDLASLIAQVEQRVGPIDVFVSNAGIAIGGGPETPDAEWRRIMDINFMSHVWAARALVPVMLRRGSGYLVTVASAAGLLTQVGSAPYAVSKHAAVAFAEWLAVTYGDRGIRVSCVCPLGVRTPMLSFGDDRITALLSPEAISPEAVADAILEGMAKEEFLILPHPQVREFVARKADDRDRWIRGMQRLQRRLEETP
ncbi:MAG: SDR family oxidoreductase [Gemmatimonadales bacterium]|nr:SDR family oxidoreductase [Gemmatimonadota bacterium]MCC7133112.1 SDR family oxidoreductase [Gemmatimonadales bacterium]MDX2058541.1 SDR family oxidoreductase [Gemmatimonadales bacterium]